VLPHLRGGWVVSRLHAALAAAGRGWPVFPLRPGQKRPRANLTAWEERATTDTDRIGRWWTRHPDDNIAVATGPAGLVVVDLDLAPPDEPRPAYWPDARGGIDVFAALAARHAHPPGATWTVETGGGGRHLYYLAPIDGGPWRNTAGRAGWHIDTRAGGGYVVAAGSEVDGRRYTVIHDRPPIELPGWLARRLTPPALPPTPARGADLAPKGRGYAASALAGEVARVLDAPAGQRNWALNRAAWNLARHIATGLMSRELVEHSLTEVGIAAGGQTAAGVAATIRCAIDARLGRGGTR
jgi:Bifunctional DNA primase/polymerase, N-terminal